MAIKYAISQCLAADIDLLPKKGTKCAMLNQSEKGRSNFFWISVSK